VGTVNYIAPEVMLCRAPTDLRAADLWSTGCILHEILLGRVPFELGPDPTDWAGAAAAAATCDTAMEAARAVGCDTTTVSVARMLCGDEGGGGRGGGGNAEPRVYYGAAAGGAAPPPAASPLDPLSAQVVGSTLHRDPSMRPTARQLLGHPYWLMRTGGGGGGGDAGAGISTAGTSPASSAQLGMLTVGGGGAVAQPLPLLLPQLEAAPARSQLPPGAASAHGLALPPGAATPALLGSALLVLADGGGAPMDLPAHPAEGALVALSGGAGWPSHTTARHVMQLDRLGHHQWPHTLDGLDPHGDLRWIQAAAMFASGGGVGAGGRCLSWTDAQRQSEAARRGSWCSSGEDDDDDGGGGGGSDDDDGCGGWSGMDHPALLMDLGGSSDEDVSQWSRDSV
jgi:hypothetical protein